MSRKKEKEEGLCGIGLCKPKCLQPCANIKVFAVFYGFNILVTVSIGVYFSSQITSIEKQFNFSSEESGIISSTKDIGFVFTVLLFSFFARRSHIPILLGISTVLFGISGIIASIPYFLFPVEEIPQALNSTNTVFGNEGLCSTESDIEQNYTLKATSALTDLSQETKMSNKPAMLILCLGMALQGIGNAPRSSLASTYIDDTLEKTKVGLFVGFITGIGIIGPAIAFILGAQFSAMYVNLKKTNITPHDSRWIGAWWLGFLVFGAASFVAALPMFYFPKKMKNRRVDLKPEKHKDKGEYIKEFLALFWKLMKRPVYLLQCFKSIVVIFVMAGTFPFTAKYVETQYQLPSWKSNIFIGAFGILIAAFGTIAGGVMTYKYKMTPMACLRFTIVINLISCIFPVTGYMLGCKQPVILKPGETSGLFATLSNNCTRSCTCTDDMFQPVCGADGANYYSPCHAGCTSMFNGTYNDCSCVQSLIKTASPSYCPTDCTNLWPAIIVGLIAAFFQCLSLMPSYILILRSIKEVEKPFALGFQNFLLSLLGFIPGPIVFGKVVDSACLKWRSTTEKGGMCMLYDLHDFRLKFSLARFIASVIIFLSFLGVYYFARHLKDWQTNEDIPEIHFDAEEEKVFIEKNSNVDMNDTVS
ncbi:unnamed protein product [Acanthosepion pharaonis]|uniref:Solute carrier organic anion transporter family member n=1 Tax=Acanthosepion pharaonis TaxID=158019 RepID=A0A812AV12_ACAPH|nr:unnamed protein product [Sepia pharaonis]